MNDDAVVEALRALVDGLEQSVSGLVEANDDIDEAIVMVRGAVEFAPTDVSAFALAFTDWLSLLAIEIDASQLRGPLRNAIKSTPIVAPAWSVAMGGLLCAYGSVLIGLDFDARSNAVQARQEMATLGAPHSEQLADLLGFNAFQVYLEQLSSVATELSRIATTTAPLVRVETNGSIPSTLLAWKLYADPNRANEIVRRNKVATPLILPVAVEALAQ